MHFKLKKTFMWIIEEKSFLVLFNFNIIPIFIL